MTKSSHALAQHASRCISSFHSLRASLLLPLILACGGCVSSALYAVKAMTTASGEVVVEFESETPNPSLSVIETPAIIGATVEARMSEVLTASGRFRQVVTPFEVRTIMNQAGYPQDLSGLTDSDDLKLFAIICDKSKADAVIGFDMAGGQVDLPNHFEIFYKRASGSQDLIMRTYACDKSAVVSADAFTVTLYSGHSSPDTNAMNRLIGEELGKHYLKISARQQQ